MKRKIIIWLGVVGLVLGGGQGVWADDEMTEEEKAATQAELDGSFDFDPDKALGKTDSETEVEPRGTDADSRIRRERESGRLHPDDPFAIEDTEVEAGDDKGGDESEKDLSVHKLLQPVSSGGVSNLPKGDVFGDVLPAVIKILLIIAGGLALASFAYSAVKMVAQADKSDQLEAAKKNLIYSVVGMAVAGFAYTIVAGIINIPFT